MKFFKLTALSAIAVVACAMPVNAQPFYPPVVFDASLTKFFEPKSAFRASVEIISRYPDGKADRWPVHVAMLNGMTRVEMDITQMKSENPAQSGEMWKKDVAMMKSAGSAEAVSIFNPRKKFSLIALPRLKSYVQHEIPGKEVEQLQKRPKFEKVEIAREEISGHSCTKYKLTFEKEGMDVWRTWESPAAFVWSAKNFRGYPMRIDAMDSVGGTNVTLIFTDIDLKAPSPELFDVPKSFVKYDDENALIKRIMEQWPKDK